MPEIMSECRQSAGRIEELIAVVTVRKEKINPDREYEKVPGEVSAMIPAAGHQALQRKKARAKESSRFFGVRFRPDLGKWVAEIRVAEWKAVDKKVWLGTFPTEEGAARAVDAARKLLRCQKKRLPNFACEALREYSESIPASLLLENLCDGAMFKSVTAFVKRKAKEYAASFAPSCTSLEVSSSSPCLRDQQLQLVSHPSKIQVGDENRGFQMASTMEPHQLYQLPESDVSPSSYSPSSYVSYEAPFTSPGNDHVYNTMLSDMSMPMPMPMPHTAIGAYNNWLSQDEVEGQTSIVVDELSECPFIMDGVVQDPYHALYAHVQSFLDEEFYMDNNTNTNDNWMIQNINNIHTSHLENVQVC